MKLKLILTLGIIALTIGFIGCTASFNTSNNANAKPANAANATTTNTAANTAANTSSAANTASNSTAATDKKQDFILVNKTGVTIDSLFITPHSSDDWEDDILGQDTLADGETLDIKFHRSNTDAMWDLKIQDTKGASIEWENLNLLKIKKVTLHYDGKKATAETE